MSATWTARAGRTAALIAAFMTFTMGTANVTGMPPGPPKASGPAPHGSAGPRPRTDPAQPPAATDSQPGTVEECRILALRATLLKARQELGTRYGEGFAAHPETVGPAMDANGVFQKSIVNTFADSDIVASEFDASMGCVVTIRLPLASLRDLADKSL